MSARLTKLFLAIPHIPHLTFLWPEFLWLLLLIPLTAGLYVLLLYRRKKTALRYANLSMVKAAMGAVGWRRHVPPALMLLALTLLLIAVARPTAVVSLPSTRATVILAMDVSGSMRATDVNPSRVEAAQAAAKQYIKSQPKDVVIGIVAFAATAFLVQSPTVDHTALFNAIDHFELQRGTAVGSGILTAMSSIFPRENFPIANYYSGGFGNGSGGFGFGGGDRFNRFGGRALGDRGPAGPPKKHVPVEPGSYKNAVIILLTDGQTNAGYDPIEAARIASEYGVKVYTVGFGTTRGNVVGFGGFSMRAQLDEDALKKIADMTRGRYFHAASADDLKAVYGVLSKQLVMETQQMEISSFFAAAAALVMLIAASLSLAWFSRVI
ncbi:MAG TPA: VWA domain-containing protein [Rhizomicrobium sp.]|jgi:Ca-activated chloride channel family protein|nr:VWA domain-containing protein [Rhizomicrobium sp.]